MFLIRVKLFQIVVSLTVISPGEVHIDNFGNYFLILKMKCEI